MKQSPDKLSDKQSARRFHPYANKLKRKKRPHLDIVPVNPNGNEESKNTPISTLNNQALGLVEIEDLGSTIFAKELCKKLGDLGSLTFFTAQPETDKNKAKDIQPIEKTDNSSPKKPDFSF